MTRFAVEAIGVVRSDRAASIDDDWDAVESSIELDPEALEPEATLGLDGFSHIEVVYLFHLADPSAACRGARRPRGNPDWPMTGILAQRAKDRPNGIGVTVCRLLSVEGAEGRTLRVQGLDAIDGTPILDIKPYLSGFAPRGDVREPTWSLELMAGYW
jgi:tRNA-Thr(GGU) m(6)t(6)A37 methyltransferase TsaA